MKRLHGFYSKTTPSLRDVHPVRGGFSMLSSWRFIPFWARHGNWPVGSWFRIPFRDPTFLHLSKMGEAKELKRGVRGWWNSPSETVENIPGLAAGAAEEVHSRRRTPTGEGAGVLGDLKDEKNESLKDEKMGAEHPTVAFFLREWASKRRLLLDKTVAVRRSKIRTKRRQS